MEYEFKLVKLSKTNLFDNTQSVEDNLNSNYSNGWDEQVSTMPSKIIKKINDILSS